MTTEVALQAVVAALKYGKDISVAAFARNCFFSSEGSAYLYPGSGVTVQISEEALDLLSVAHNILHEMPEDSVGSYGTTTCDLITFNHLNK